MRRYAYDSFAYLSPRLARAGFCVFAFNFGRSGLLAGGGLGPILPGRYGVGRMEDSPRQLSEFGSPFYATLNAQGDTVSGVEYTSVGSRLDQVMNPYDWSFLRPGPGATVHNITLQEGCEQDLSDHLTIMYSPRSAAIALRALDPVAYPNLECTFNPWLIGGSGSL